MSHFYPVGLNWFVTLAVYSATTRPKVAHSRLWTRFCSRRPTRPSAQAALFTFPVPLLARAARTSRDTVNKWTNCMPGQIATPARTTVDRLLVRGRDRLTGGQTYNGNEQKSSGFLRVKSAVETLAGNGLVRRTTRHLWVSKYSLTVLFLDTILSSFFAIRTSSSSRVIVAFTPAGGCFQGRRINEGGESWLKRSVLDALSRTLRTACSIQSGGVSCSGTQSDQHDT